MEWGVSDFILLRKGTGGLEGLLGANACIAIAALADVRPWVGGSGWGRGSFSSNIPQRTEYIFYNM